MGQRGCLKFVWVFRAVRHEVTILLRERVLAVPSRQPLSFDDSPDPPGDVTDDGDGDEDPKDSFDRRRNGGLSI